MQTRRAQSSTSAPSAVIDGTTPPECECSAVQSTAQTPPSTTRRSQCPLIPACCVLRPGAGRVCQSVSRLAITRCVFGALIGSPRALPSYRLGLPLPYSRTVAQSPTSHLISLESYIGSLPRRYVDSYSSDPISFHASHLISTVSTVPCVPISQLLLHLWLSHLRVHLPFYLSSLHSIFCA